MRTTFPPSSRSSIERPSTRPSRSGTDSPLSNAATGVSTGPVTASGARCTLAPRSTTTISRRSSSRNAETWIRSWAPASPVSVTAFVHASEPASFAFSTNSGECCPRRATAPSRWRTTPTNSGRGGISISTSGWGARSGPQGLVQGPEDREDLGQAGDVEDLEDAVLRGDEFHRALFVLHALQAADEDAEAGGVEKVDLLHVDDDRGGAALHQVDKGLPEPGRRVDVDLP